MASEDDRHVCGQLPVHWPDGLHHWASAGRQATRKRRTLPPSPHSLGDIVGMRRFMGWLAFGYDWSSWHRGCGADSISCPVSHWGAGRAQFPLRDGTLGLVRFGCRWSLDHFGDGVRYDLLPDSSGGRVSSMGFVNSLQLGFVNLQHGVSSTRLRTRSQVLACALYSDPISAQLSLRKRLRRLSLADESSLARYLSRAY